MSDESKTPSLAVQVAATREERERVFRFRYEAYASEFGRWPAAEFRGRRMVREGADQDAVLLFVESGGRMLGTLRLAIGPLPPDVQPGFGAWRFRGFKPAELGYLDRVFVPRAFRRTSLLSDLLFRASGEAIGRGVEALFGLVREGQAELYASLGFRPCAPAFEHPESGIVLPHVSPVGGEGASARLATALSVPAGGRGASSDRSDLRAR